MKGFSLLEMAIALLVGSLVMSGLLTLVQTMTTSRQNQIQQEATETTKTTIALSAISNKTIATGCVPGTCSGLITVTDCALTLVTAPCSVYIYTYPVPATITTEKDFWGNQMTYTRVTTSVTSATPANTTIYTLKSKGPDATDGTTDDITYTVLTPEFLMRISKLGL